MLYFRAEKIDYFLNKFSALPRPPPRKLIKKAVLADGFSLFVS